MLVIVKSTPDTVNGKGGVKMASDMAADMVLLQNGPILPSARGWKVSVAQCTCLMMISD